MWDKKPTYCNKTQGKSFLLSIFCCTRCILYPGTIIAITSKTRKQSAEILDKIQTILMPASPYLRAEIKEREIVNNLTDGHIAFNNGSLIKTVVANDNARHNRANIVVIDLPLVAVMQRVYWGKSVKAKRAIAS